MPRLVMVFLGWSWCPSDTPMDTVMENTYIVPLPGAMWFGDRAQTYPGRENLWFFSAYLVVFVGDIENYLSERGD